MRFQNGMKQASVEGMLALHKILENLKWKKVNCMACLYSKWPSGYREILLILMEF